MLVPALNFGQENEITREESNRKSIIEKFEKL